MKDNKRNKKYELLILIINNIKIWMNALLPNYYHYLDGILCMKVLEESFKLNINLITVHDCYYVNISDI